MIDAPTDTGGEPLIEYVVECTGTDGFRLDHSSPDNQLLVSGVEPGQTYFVRIHASNSTGIGAPSDVCMIHTPPVAPGIPTPPALIGRPKATGVALRWGVNFMQIIPIVKYFSELSLSFEVNRYLPCPSLFLIGGYDLLL